MPEPITQTEYWNGDVGARWAGMQAELDQVFAPLTASLLEGAGLRPGERVLDIGCGCGEIALLAAARSGAGGGVTAVDVSRPMLARARTRPATGAPIRWIEADAQTHPLAQEHDRGHDVALSRFGVMFFEDSCAAFANIRRALRPGGRLAVLCWRALAENPWVSLPRAAVLSVVPEPAASPPGSPGPFRFAEGEALVDLLGQAGFTGAAVAPIECPLEIGADPEAATRFSATVGPIAGLLREIDDPALRERALAALRDAMPAEGPVRLGAACWLATAVNPG
ncbi:class I SAM-dependent methyltransferase [Methylobacterium frigidaeris]|uniref:2-methoxy-6-polyprenyl-1,4-benzoquinol methylase, mitochondrial n=1 Tax=Methylobacterium frigidaeris TaxID=2038277 RepID=A0AA37M6T2_9HYPH|nr:class I SAM-dependent methyltransferase [Methylobacterium frigidaeris]PIK71001.1 methyltransferase type 11 [Methylobacterium frigidaeris]GJD64121.1 2-methoxy-6-polyprenyl-1,4-benzoquinol methylase, mitochondrial [Methylobacterium frigidaeris]